MVNPIAEHPSRAASFTLPVTAEQGGCPATFPPTGARTYYR